jgi:16S rRNA (adenine1518-N6/adenine1519-N6)-dimethyltransferase
MNDPKALLTAHGLAAKKSFGQNFLRDQRVHAAVAQALGAMAGDHIVELGAGLGTLTHHLAATTAKVFAVERDRELVPILRQEFAQQANVSIVEGNAKALDFAAYAPPPPARLFVAGNIPYQLTSPIIFAVLAERARVAAVALLVQREVADRIVAPPGSRTYGLLSVLIGAVADVRKVMNVGRGAFVPPPRVDSAVIAWRFRAVETSEDFVPLVKAAFQQRRKTLRNAIAAFPHAIAAAPALGIDLQARPETLTPVQFVALASARLAAR